MKKNGKSITRAGDGRVGYFDRLADGWDGDPGKVARTIARLEDLRGLLALKAGEDLLEVGCGTGQITGWLCLAVSPGRVVAVDFSLAMLDRARAKRMPAEFRLVDICLESPGQCGFDVALCFHSFPHFRDKRAALENLRKSLRPAGRLIVMHLAGREQINAMHSGFGGPVGHDHLPDERAWAEMLAAVGLAADELIDRKDLYFLRATAPAT